MEKHIRLEASLDGELAEFYAGLIEEIEGKSSVSLAELNRTLLQTGLIHHFLMLQGLGVVEGANAERLAALAERLGRASIFWAVLETVRRHWQQNQGGGSLDIQA